MTNARFTCLAPTPSFEYPRTWALNTYTLRYAYMHKTQQSSSWNISLLEELLTRTLHDKKAHEQHVSELQGLQLSSLLVYTHGLQCSAQK